MLSISNALTVSSAPLIASLGSAVLGWLMFFLSVFLILLILVQRGKGGGLTGALGGPGGQSAFGSKAGDTFTLITAVSAIIWGFVCAIAMYTMGVPPLTADDASFEIDDTPALTAPKDQAGDATGAGGLSGLSGLLSDPAGESTTDDGDSATDASDEDSGASSEGTPSAELGTDAESEGDAAEGDTAEVDAADSVNGSDDAEGSDSESAGTDDTSEE